MFLWLAVAKGYTLRTILPAVKYPAKPVPIHSDGYEDGKWQYALDESLPAQSGNSKAGGQRFCAGPRFIKTLQRVRDNEGGLDYEAVWPTRYSEKVLEESPSVERRDSARKTYGAHPDCTRLALKQGEGNCYTTCCTISPL